MKQPSPKLSQSRSDLQASSSATDPTETATEKALRSTFNPAATASFNGPGREGADPPQLPASRRPAPAPTPALRLDASKHAKAVKQSSKGKQPTTLQAERNLPKAGPKLCLPGGLSKAKGSNLASLPQRDLCMPSKPSASLRAQKKKVLRFQRVKQGAPRPY